MSIKLTPFIDSFQVNFTPSTELDVEYYIVHAVPNEQLIDGDFTPTEDNLINRGPETNFVYSTLKKGETEPTNGTWYVKVAAVDSFGEDLLNYSSLCSVSVPEFMLMPDQLFTSLRTDFWVHDSIFTFKLPPDTVTTLDWTAGSIVRGDLTYTLAPGSLVSAQGSYLIATLDSGITTITLTKIAEGVPTLAENQIIVGVTSTSPLDSGNYVAYMRQANSVMYEGAAIRDLTVTNGKIKNLSASKLTAGTIDANVVNIQNLTVGNNVAMGPNATISWANVSNSPSSLAALSSTDAARLAAAEAEADNATTKLAEMAADSKFTPVEKQAVRTDWGGIYAEKQQLVTQATSYGVSTEKTTYISAYTTLANYLNGGAAWAENDTTPPAWISDAGITSTTNVTGTTFWGMFKAYYDARQKLMSKLTNMAATLATWTGVSGVPELVKANGVTTLGSSFIYTGLLAANQVNASGFTADTANIKDLAVQTIKVADGAISNTVSAWTGGMLYCAQGQTIVLQTATITKYGTNSKVLIQGSSYLWLTGSMSGVYVTIRRNGSELVKYTIPLGVAVLWPTLFVDAPPPGDYVYTIAMYNQGSVTVPSQQHHMSVTEIKK